MKWKLGWSTTKVNFYPWNESTNKLIYFPWEFNFGWVSPSNTLVSIKWRYDNLFSSFSELCGKNFSWSGAHHKTKPWITYRGCKKDRDKTDNPFNLGCGMFAEMGREILFCGFLEVVSVLDYSTIAREPFPGYFHRRDPKWKETLNDCVRSAQFPSLLLSLVLPLSIGVLGEEAEPFLQRQRMTGANPSRAG